MENLLITFIVITGLAVVLQAAILVALYLSVRQASARGQQMLGEIHQRAVPLLDKMSAASENLVSASATLKLQMQRVDSTLSDVLDRTRLQVIRADEMITRTLDRVEETTEVVQHTVISPVRQLAGLISGMSAGLNSFFNRRRRAAANGEPQQQDEELFI